MKQGQHAPACGHLLAQQCGTGRISVGGGGGKDSRQEQQMVLHSGVVCCLLLNRQLLDHHAATHCLEDLLSSSNDASGCICEGGHCLVMDVFCGVGGCGMKRVEEKCGADG